jgi:Fe(3+) dicitrate transport protein
MSGGGTGTGDLFNAGAAIVKGIEFSATYDI